MSIDAPLLSAMFDLTRGDLERALFPYVAPSEYLHGMAAVRITRMSEFWKSEPQSEARELLECTEDLCRGFYGRRLPWTFAVIGMPGEIQCWYATPSAQCSESSLQSLVRGAFPGTTCSSPQADWSNFDGFASGFVLTGTPSAQQVRGTSSQRDQLGQVCRTLWGNKWLYIVSARPQPTADTVRQINKITTDIKETQASVRLQQSAIDVENRTAKRFVELLEAKLQRWEAGRVGGMWAVRRAFYAETDATSDLARVVFEAAYSGDQSVPDPVRACGFTRSSQSSPAVEVITSREAAILGQMPREEWPGFELVECARFGVEPTRCADGKSISVGEIVDRATGTGNWLEFSRDDLTKHGLIAGITGSGKTNSCHWILDQVWDAGRGVPFLVIESAKSEYRNLLFNPRFRALRVFTVADETVAPLRINPFEVPAHTLAQTHIDYLKSLFAAAFVLFPPMPYVLERSLQEIYEDRGWDLSGNTNSRGTDSARAYPNLDDLAAKIPAVVGRMGYDQRISMDVKAALLARINQLRLAGGKGQMLNTRQALDEAALFEAPCVLELKRLVSDDEKAFIIGLILIRLSEYREGKRRQSSGLAHVTLIEEAHRLLRNVSPDQGSDVVANPRGRAVEVFTNLLSEVRAFGEGILVAEQIPAKLAPDVVKNTGFKLIHRLVSADDRTLLGRTTNLNDAQSRRLASLPTGEAAAWTEHTAKAVLVRVPECAAAGVASDETVRQRARQTSPAGASLLPFRACNGCAGARGTTCGASKADSWQQPLLEAFRRAFNAVRRQDSGIGPAFAEFTHLAQRESRGSHAGNPLCTMVAMAEGDIERRGEFGHWGFSDVNTLVESFCDSADHAMRRGDEQTAPHSAPESLRVFRELCGVLHHAETLPFPGCRLCQAPCQFRFDMAQTDPLLARDFQRTFAGPAEAQAQLPAIARAAATRSFFIGDTEGCAGAAYCFGVQQLAAPELNLATFYQFRVAATFKAQIDARS